MLNVTVEDRAAIDEVIALHGHLADGDDWDRLGEVFTHDVVFDITDIGYSTLHGLPAMQELVRDSRGDPRQPLGHHVTNTVIVGRDGEKVRAHSKALTVAADGTSASAVYEDLLRHEEQGWRISYRKVIARRATH